MPARTITVLPTSKGKATAQTTRVVLYARVSSKDQEKEGFSIPAQLKVLREYAAENDYEIVQEFTDVETAKKIDESISIKCSHWSKKISKFDIFSSKRQIDYTVTYLIMHT